MKWVTRERPKIDRIACPWLIAKFIDEAPEFLYVPSGDVLNVAEKTGAIPYDIPDVEFSHVGELCSFDAFLRKYNLTQRLLRYTTQDVEIYIPTIELIRYLFLHNRTLANALMRPSALSLLHRPELPGFRKELHLEFTKEMPIRSLSNKFAQEFAWLAFDTEARKSWDSVYLKSKGKEYLTLSPPPLQNSQLRFRGLKAGNRWLVLEILSMTGRHQPCDKLIYSHPQLQKQRIIKREEPTSEPGIKAKDDSKEQAKKYEYEYKLESGSNGAQSLARQQALEEITKLTGFDKEIVVEKRFVDVEATVANAKSSDNLPAEKEQKTVWVSAAEQGINAEVPPIEFKVLTPASWDLVGDLEGTVKTIERLSVLAQT